MFKKLIRTRECLKIHSLYIIDGANVGPMCQPHLLGCSVHNCCVSRPITLQLAILLGYSMESFCTMLVGLICLLVF